MSTISNELGIQLEISNKRRDVLFKRKHILHSLKNALYTQISVSSKHSTSLSSSNRIRNNQIIQWIFPSYPSSREILKSSDYSIIQKLQNKTTTTITITKQRNKKQRILNYQEDIIAYKQQLQRKILDDILERNKKQKLFKQQLKIILENKQKFDSELQININELNKLRTNRIIELLEKFKSSIENLKSGNTTPLTPLQLILNDIQKLNDYMITYYFDTSRIKEIMVLIKDIKIKIKHTEAEYKIFKQTMDLNVDIEEDNTRNEIIMYPDSIVYPIVYYNRDNLNDKNEDEDTLKIFESIISKAYITKLSKSIGEIDYEIIILDNEIKENDIKINSLSNDIKNIKYSNEWRRLMRFQDKK